MWWCNGAWQPVTIWTSQCKHEICTNNTAVTVIDQFNSVTFSYSYSCLEPDGATMLV